VAQASIVPQGAERIEVCCPPRWKIARYSRNGEQQQGQTNE
jgi:hypothetical protein